MERPPFDITPEILSLVAEVERMLGRMEGRMQYISPMLRRAHRIRSVQASTAIEGNVLTEKQVTAVLEGRRVAGPARDILEVQNALAAYEQLTAWKPESPQSFLKAHRLMMTGLTADTGRWRSGGVGIMQGRKLVHLAPPAANVPTLMASLLSWLKQDRTTHPAIKAAVCHYEIEFIHPFSDGNGRMGRLWHTLILARSHEAFAGVPLESIIRQRQKEYYASLAASDAAGRATPFVTFAMQALAAALRESSSTTRSGPVTAAHRLEFAARHFGKDAFSRRDYLRLFPTLSSATASRDLAAAVAQKRLRKSGDKALTSYRFHS